MPSFDFVRLGIPCTVQTRNKSRLDNYRRDIRRIVQFQWPDNVEAVTGPVNVTLSYSYAIDILDVDNIIKPVLDELKMLVYADDKQVTKVVSQKQPLSVDLPGFTVTPALGSGLRSQTDFLYVLVEWEE